ncbi:hypothetical protein [Candidatus Phytoplasma melaleucae]|uniref:DNA polymerase III subunit delta n=1 Tax=Candidatus Phytoplasma melaleucae TaxID=2982630 RepID=A0ABT9DDH9_9MOLU|nr:hypothetical protein ['Melaleuca sp.' phytoplasma]MDO8168095.1 hypothetical protein ['Melaleuca sp.' phytoplasma]
MNTSDFLLKQFKTIIKNDKLSHLYLIEGGSLQEQKKLAFDLAYEFLKKNSLHIPLMTLIQQNNYPNFYYLCQQNSLPIKREQILEMYNYFGQTSLIQQKKVYVIEEIEHIHKQSISSLLYFLENPINENILGILLTSNINLVLPTILSRAQVFSLSNHSNYVLDNDSIIKKRGALDFILISLLVDLHKKDIHLSKDNYYLDFKKFFLFCINVFDHVHFLQNLFVQAQFLTLKDHFMHDFIFIMTKFFLDLHYKKSNLAFSFPENLLNKKFFLDLTLPQINIFLEVFARMEKKVLFLNNTFCLMALLLEIEQKKKEL